MDGMNTWERGQLIVVKYVNGSFWIRRLWSVVELGVYILSESEWEKRCSGSRSLEPVGFPKDDIYLYNTELMGVAGPDGELSSITPKSMTKFPTEIST